jgi:hypothetical protein
MIVPPMWQGRFSRLNRREREAGAVASEITQICSQIDAMDRGVEAVRRAAGESCGLRRLVDNGVSAASTRSFGVGAEPNHEDFGAYYSALVLCPNRVRHGPRCRS